MVKGLGWVRSMKIFLEIRKKINRLEKNVVGVRRTEGNLLIAESVNHEIPGEKGVEKQFS